MHTIDDLFESGLRFFRLRSNSKKPIGETWTIFDVDAEYEDFAQKRCNLGVLADQKIEGKGWLCIVDVDKQNDGFASLEKLEADHGELPGTFTVNTPSGGFHAYYYTKARHKKRAKNSEYPGIDVLANGYAVAPFSEIDGVRYEVAPDYDFDEICELPQKFQQIFFPQELSFSAKDYDEDNTVPMEVESNHDDHLVKEAGGLRRIGYTREQIVELLETRFKQSYERYQNAKHPYTRADFERIAKSAEKWQIEEPIFKIEADKTYKSQINEPNWGLCYEATRGKFREYVDLLLAHARFEYPQFALTTAIGSFAGVFQGAYATGNIAKESSEADGHLSFLILNVAPPGFGKDTYFRAAEIFAKNIHTSLLLPTIGSSQGMRGYIYAFNSRVAVIDEATDFFIKVGNKQAAEHMKQIGTDLKILANGPISLPKIAIKSSTYPEISDPRMTVIGFGTTGGLTKMLDADIIQGGLLSRMIITGAHNKPEANADFSPLPKKLDFARAYKKYFAAHANMENYAVDEADYIREHAKATNSTDHSQVIHKPRFHANSVVIQPTPGAREAWREYNQWCDKEHRRLIKLNPNVDDLSAASLYTRAPMLAWRLACLHAAANGSVLADEFDVRFGVTFMREHTKFIGPLVDGNAAETITEKKTKQLLQKIERKGHVSKRDAQNFRVFKDAKQFHTAVYNLAALGEIFIATDKSANSFYEIDELEYGQVPRGSYLWHCNAIKQRRS